MAITGRIAFGSACRNSTRQRVSPLARAVRTKSCPSTSISDERMIRPYQPAPISPSVSAGSTTCAGVP